jgi:pimeloyl-ACP methyl ester carboxylesterase
MSKGGDARRAVVRPRSKVVRVIWLSGLVLSLGCSGAAAQQSGQSSYVTIDRFVPHESTVPINQGQRIALFVREKLAGATETAIADDENLSGRVVLFVHGVSVPSIPDFDLDHADYSWMSYLAAAGFDTFAMDQTGYGYSARPSMDNPCNLGEADRNLLDTEVLPKDCLATYGSLLTSSQTDWDEIDTVVDFIRDLRGVDRVSLIGWSLGGLRAGGYAARFPEKIDKLFLFAPFYQPDSSAMPPVGYPLAGAAMTLQTETALMQDRWSSNVACENQVTAGIQDRVWQAIMAVDDYGSIWSSPRGVMRVRSASYWGWNTASAARIDAPTMIVVGLQDGLLPGAEALYRDVAGTDNKVLVRMECATHFAVWEASQYRFMHAASLQWLTEGRYRGANAGEFRVGFGGEAIE